MIDTHIHLTFTDYSLAERELLILRLQDEMKKANIKSYWIIANKAQKDQNKYFFDCNRKTDPFKVPKEFDGIKLHSKKMSKQEFENKALTFAEMNNPMIIHCAVYEQQIPAMCVEKIAKISDKPVIIAHMGGIFHKQYLGVAEKYENIFFETSGFQGYLKDSIKKIGKNRFLFGSDFPANHIHEQLNDLIKTGIPNIKQITYENAKEVEKWIG